jgi:hypothetical protein
MERDGTPYDCTEDVEGVCQMEIEIVESASDSLGTEVTHVP